jgi:hypothetical protein
MCCPLQLKIGHLPLDHARIGAGVPFRQALGQNVQEQTCMQQRPLFGHHQLKLGAAHHFQGMHKAQPGSRSAQQGGSCISTRTA